MRCTADRLPRRSSSRTDSCTAVAPTLVPADDPPAWLRLAICGNRIAVEVRLCQDTQFHLGDSAPQRSLDALMQADTG